MSEDISNLNPDLKLLRVNKAVYDKYLKTCKIVKGKKYQIASQALEEGLNKLLHRESVIKQMEADGDFDAV